MGKAELFPVDYLYQVCIDEGSALILETENPDALQDLRIPVRGDVQFQFPDLVLQDVVSRLHADDDSAPISVDLGLDAFKGQRVIQIGLHVVVRLIGADILPDKEFSRRDGKP